MQVVHYLDRNVWQSFVENQATGNIFHTPEMFEVFKQAKGYDPSLWVVVDDITDAPFALMMPVNVTLTGRLPSQFSTRSIMYGSIVYAEGDAGEQACNVLLEEYKKETKGKVLFTELRNLSELLDLQPIFESKKFIYEAYLNYLIDLDRSPQEILQSFGKRSRKKIRRVLRDNQLEITEVTSRAGLREWYTILSKTYAHAHVPLPDTSLFEAAFNILVPKYMAKFLLAQVNGTVVACSLELPYKNTIYGWYGGVDRSYSQYIPSEMIMWHILEWGSNNGYQIYDFGGAGKPDEEYGVRNFKAKFNGKLVCYGRNIWVKNRLLLHLSKIGYWVYRKLL